MLNHTQPNPDANVAQHLRRQSATRLARIISGGQTGVDRAALDIAVQFGVDCGGWCPRGRKAEDGPIDLKYPLRETESGRYDVRTRRNVRDSDGTMILTVGEPQGGTALTAKYAVQVGKPVLIIHLDRASEAAWIKKIWNWIDCYQVEVLNIAGPRESRLPGIGARTASFLQKLLEQKAKNPT